jgi:hypothetical protein
MGETRTMDRQVVDAVVSAAERLRDLWDVDVALRPVSREADDASSPDDLMFMTLGGDGGTHVTYGPKRLMPRATGANRWAMAKIRHANLEVAAERFARKAMGQAGRERMIVRALERAGLPSDARPGWTYTVHPLARRLVETSGIDLARLDEHAVHLFSQGLVGIWTDNGSRVMTISASLGDGADEYEESASNRRLSLRSATLPETALARIRRIPLDDVVEHPRLSGSASIVNSARSARHGAVFAIAPAWTTLRDPPSGIATPWLETMA